MVKFLPLYFLILLMYAFEVCNAQKPVITDNPRDTLVCFHSSAVITVAASNNPTSYTWQYSYDLSFWTDVAPDVGYAGLNSPTLTVNTEYHWFLYYRCIAKNAEGSSIPSTPAFLNVSELPPPVGISGPSSVCLGASGILYSSGLNNLNTYIWSYTGSGISLHHISGDSIISIDFGINATSVVLSLKDSGVCGVVGPTTMVIIPNPIQATVAGSVASGTICTSYQYAASGGSTFSDPSSCNPITLINPSGVHPVVSNIQTCVTVDASVQSYNGVPYVARHYNMEPRYDAGISTATVTLYFTQGDFDAYNTARGSNPALPTASTDALGIGNLRITQFHGTGTTPDTYAGGSGEIDPDDNNIVWNATASRWEVTFDITGFSGFFASGGSLVPLPLTLVEFTGQPTKNGDLLHWVTSSEENTAYFEVERKMENGVGAGSTGGAGFQPLVKIPAAGNSNRTIDYSYTDGSANGLDATLSYRLHMTDIDGKSTYSKTVTLQSPIDGLSIRVLPNPSRQPLSLSVRSPQPGPATLTVTDMSGRTIRKQSLSLQKGENSLDVQLVSRLPRGQYLINIVTDLQKQTVKFISE